MRRGRPSAQAQKGTWRWKTSAGEELVQLVGVKGLELVDVAVGGILSLVGSRCQSPWTRLSGLVGLPLPIVQVLPLDQGVRGPPGVLVQLAGAKGSNSSTLLGAKKASMC